MTREGRSVVDCNTVGERLSACLDGELPASEAEAVRQHLAACAACARQYRELEEVWQAVREITPVGPRQPLWPALEARVSRRPAPGMPLRSLLAWRPFAPLAGVALAAGLWIGAGVGKLLWQGSAAPAMAEPGSSNTDSAGYFGDIPPGTPAARILAVAQAPGEAGPGGRRP